MLEPLRELSAAQFPSTCNELIVEQGMFKLYYVPTFVPSIDRYLKTSVRLTRISQDNRINWILIVEERWSPENLKIPSRSWIKLFWKKFWSHLFKGLDWKCPSLQLFSILERFFLNSFHGSIRHVKIYGAVA